MEDTVLNNIRVPIDWVCSYRQIQFLLVEYGVSAIQGCDNVCAPKNKSIIQLWNLFKNAAFLYEKGYTDKANTIYEFVKRALTKYENVDVGDSEIHVEDAIVTIKCIGNDYEFDDIKEVYENYWEKLREKNSKEFTKNAIKVVMDSLNNSLITH